MTTTENVDVFGTVAAKAYDENAERTFEVYEDKLAPLAIAIEKLSRRAKRLGVAGPKMVVGESFSRARRDERGAITYWPMVRVVVSGPSPKLNGWSFAATIDHDGEENIFRAIEKNIPIAYRTGAAICDHCAVSRRRNETFLLHADSGAWKQVGRSCLKDFLGHVDAQSLAAAAELMASALDAAEDGESYGKGARPEPEIESYLAHVALLVRLDGWLSRSAAQGDLLPTSQQASLLLEEPGPNHPKPSEEDHAVAEEALAWARALPDDASEFDANLRAASKRLSVPHKNRGLTAYIVPGFLKEKVRLAKVQNDAARAPSQWVGEVGQRYGAKGTKKKPGLPELRLLCERVTPLESQYGTTHLHHFTDDSGNIVKWFASHECLETGKTYLVTGTIKSHDEYKGTKQTLLSRCSARLA